MFLYTPSTTLLVICGFASIHLLILSLCVFWIYKFMIISYAVDAFLLLALFLGILVTLDLYAAKKNMFTRYFTRCFISKEGILCRQFCGKSWNVEWDNICVYGTYTYTFSYASCEIIFFSMNPNEAATAETIFSINRSRIFFELRDGLFDDLGIYMPDKMKKQLSIAIRERRNSYYRKRTHDTHGGSS